MLKRAELGSRTQLLEVKLRSLRKLRRNAVDAESPLDGLERRAQEHLGADGDAGVRAPLEEDRARELASSVVGVSVKHVDYDKAGVLGVLVVNRLDEGFPELGDEVASVDVVSLGVGSRLLGNVNGLVLDNKKGPEGKALTLVCLLVALSDIVELLRSGLGNIQRKVLFRAKKNKKIRKFEQCKEWHMGVVLA